MTPELDSLIVAGLGLATVLSWWSLRWLFQRRTEPDVGLALIHEDRTEDEPVETIDEALARTTDPAEIDALLDVRLRAMGGAG